MTIVNTPIPLMMEWQHAAAEAGWYVISLTVFADCVIVSAVRLEDKDEARYSKVHSVWVDRTKTYLMLEAMKTMLRMEGA